MFYTHGKTNASAPSGRTRREHPRHCHHRSPNVRWRHVGRDWGTAIQLHGRPDLGLAQELDPGIQASKAPELVVSDSFEFERFSRRPDYALAQSLFSHLPPDDIVDCLRKLRAFSPGCRLFATFFLADNPRKNPRARHDHLTFRYTREELAGFAATSGWRFCYIGEWGHPRGQVMTEFC